tara:strand:- start:237 stop:677 length:441 start_codon:yes stop_codon:yes gene_type:complete
MRILLILLFCNYINAQTICDSVSYNIGSGQTFTLIGINNSSDSVNFQWGVCYNETCYSKDGDTAVFADVDIFDTVSVCFDISPQWACNDCQYIVFANGSWQPLNTITHVNEITSIQYNSKIYDLLGRELKYVPVGIIYIKNGKLYK